MTTINSNVNGVLEDFQRNTDGTFKIKILGADGNIYIYSNLTRVCKSDTYSVGDYIGEAKDLYYAVKTQISKLDFNENSLL